MSIPKLILHACGAIEDVAYTNSKEALLKNYQKRSPSFIEIDINLTKDNQYVLIHDWQETFTNLFGYDTKTALTLAEFKQLKIKNKFSPLALAEFLDFMLENPEIYLVTDVKAGTNIELYNFLQNNYSNLLARTYIQCYDEKEYQKFKSLDFNNLILALYDETRFDYDKIIDFIKANQVEYVSLNKSVALSGYALLLKQQNTCVLTHTVNDKTELNELEQKGVNVFFTDKL